MVGNNFVNIEEIDKIKIKSDIVNVYLFFLCVRKNFVSKYMKILMKNVYSIKWLWLLNKFVLKNVMFEKIRSNKVFIGKSFIVIFCEWFLILFIVWIVVKISLCYK